jgi:hypothetical protein
MLGISTGDKREISMKSQNPAHAALTSEVFALCNKMLMSTKQVIQSKQTRQPRHIMQWNAAFPASFQSGFFPLMLGGGGGGGGDSSGA